MTVTQLLTPEQVAQALGISVQSLYKMKLRGEIPFVKIGKRLRFDQADIQKWIDSQKQKTEVS